MQKVITFVIVTIMSMSLMTPAFAADIDGVHGTSAEEPSVISIDPPTGYIESVIIDAPAGYYESADIDAPEGYEVLGSPLVAWDFSFLDYIALEKGYMVVEPKEPKDILRTYTTTVDNLRYTVTVYRDFVTACVHDRTSDFPGAIMGYPCYVEDGIVYSEYDFVTDIFARALSTKSPASAGDFVFSGMAAEPLA